MARTRQDGPGTPGTRLLGRCSLDVNGSVVAEGPAGIVSDFPDVAVGIGKGSGGAAPHRDSRGPDNRAAGALRVRQDLAHFRGRADVVGEFDAGCSMAAESGPQAEHHPSGLEEAHLVVRLLRPAPAERLIEGAGPGEVVNSEGHETDALIHRVIIAPRGAGGSDLTQPVSAVVDELHSEVELLALQQRDDRLQIVLLLGRNAKLLTLDLGLNTLRPLVPDDLGDLLGVVLGDALLQGHRHLVLPAGRLGVVRLQCLERDAALDQLVLEHVKDRQRALFAVSADVDRVLAGPADGRADATEVEPVADLLDRLVERVVNFLAVELGHDVERRVLRCHGSRLDADRAGRHAERAGRPVVPRTQRRWRQAAAHPPACGLPACEHEPASFGLKRSRLTVWSLLELFFSVPPGLAAHGRLPEWPKGAVCKTVGSAYVGSNPTPATTCENAPLAGNPRASGAFLLCPVVCHLVTLYTAVSRCPRTYSGRRPAARTVGVHRRLSTDAHGRAASAAGSGLRCAAEPGVRLQAQCPPRAPVRRMTHCCSQLRRAGRGD